MATPPMPTLAHISIDGFWGRYKVRIPFRDGRLVLVGENGTGKSTIVAMLYYCLTCQFAKLLNYEFSSIELKLTSDEKIRIDRKDIGVLGIADERPRLTRLRHVSPATYQSIIEEFLTHYPTREFPRDPEMLRTIARKLDIAPSLVADSLESYVRQWPLDTKEKVGKIAAQIRTAFPQQILYLPTYRRIERDLRALFPDLSGNVEQMLTEVTAVLSGPNYYELVQFGTRDVERMISRALEELKDFVRTNLARLTGRYLRDVLNGLPPVDIRPLLQMDEATQQAISRWTRDILPQKKDQDLLATTINRLKRGGIIQEEDKYAAYFIITVIRLLEQLREQEERIDSYLSVVGKYLSGKELAYDNVRFEFSVKEIRPISGPTTFEPRLLRLNDLSSGEKQIVSLFAHLYLSGKDNFFVFVDEPELSLSVPWQRRLLPDIWSTGLCTGLVAVTHSPFIFENEFDSHTHSLQEFVTWAGQNS